MGLFNFSSGTRGNQPLQTNADMKKSEQIISRLGNFKSRIEKGDILWGTPFEGMANDLYALIIEIDTYNKGIHVGNRWKEEAVGCLNELYMRRYRYIKASFDNLSQRINANLRALENPREIREPVLKRLKELKTKLVELNEDLNTNSNSPHYRLATGDRLLNRKYTLLSKDMVDFIKIFNSKNI